MDNTVQLNSTLQVASVSVNTAEDKLNSIEGVLDHNTLTEIENYINTFDCGFFQLS